MPLPRERLARLAQLIDELYALPEAQHGAWLDALSPDDAELRPFLQTMDDDAAQRTLSAADPAAADGAPADTLWRDTPERAFDVVRQLLGEPGEPRAGQRLGPWRLLHPLGRGGMGVVWCAERCDGAYQRHVALKLPLQGPAPARLAERFARERDILAAMSHPHIAALHDAGVDLNGQPYMALELVHGQAVLAWADERQLGLRARIAPMLQVLQAVRHAHQHLVVHRDLKPSNILVDAQGSVQLLDFGIARLLDDGRPTVQGSPVATPELTEFGSAVMTPTYAAPEQIERKPLSTASDLYSLGVVLYELLAGSSPYRPENSGRAALEEAILHIDPQRPSQAATPEAAQRRGLSVRELRQQLRGDLDAIVLKALRKRPSDRYDSAEAMAQDLQRWLDGLPVLAQPDRLAYRLHKFLRRHLVSSIAAAVAVLALLVGSGVAWWQADVARGQAQRAAAEASNARRQAQRAEAAQAFLIEMFDAGDPARAQGHEPTVRELMAYAERLLPSRLASQPELANHLRGALTEIYLKLSEEKRALPLAEARVASLRAGAGVDAAELGAAIFQLGVVQGEIGRNEIALSSYIEAEKLLAPVPGAAAGSESKDYLQLQAKIGHALLQARQWPQARQRMGTALPALQARLGAQSFDVLDAKVTMINIQIRVGERDAAMALLKEIEPQLDDANPVHAMDVAKLRHSIALTLMLDGQWAEAERLQLRSLAELERLVGPRNSTTIVALQQRAMLLDTVGRVREADAALARAVELAHAFYGESDAQTALAESFRVAPLLKLGRMAEAEAAARLSLRIAEGQPGLREGARRGLTRRLGLALLFNGHAPEALRLLETVVQGDGAAPQAPSLTYLTAARLANGQIEQAHASAAAALELMKNKRTAFDRFLYAMANLNMALVLAAQARPEQAQAPIDLAQSIFRELLPAESLQQTWPTLVRAQVLRAQRQFRQATALDATARRRWLDEGVPVPAVLWLVH